MVTVKDFVDGVEVDIQHPNHKIETVSALPGASRHTTGPTKNTLPENLQGPARARLNQ
jgi:hypothetical protein